VRRRIGRAWATGLAMALLLAGCGADTPGPDPETPSPAAVGPRPSSAAVVEIVRPTNGERVAADAATLEIELKGASLTDATTQDISPTEGHLHVSVDGQLVSMTSGFTQLLPVLERGRHTVRVEFVAADHLPFDPRVVTQGFFEVR
jgi:hypothetical protein